jgi:hypothetical protein
VQEKYFIIINEDVVCLKYDFSTNETVVGGSINFRHTMESVLSDYFTEKLPKMKFTQKNKIRYVFKLSKLKFDEIITELRENNFIVERTKSHGRLMR